MANVAVVTGAGSGVGRAVVVMLAQRGWDVAVLGRRREMLDETIKAAQVAGKSSKLVPFVCDVGKESDVKTMADGVRKQLGNPTLLVNSAGVNIPRRTLADLTSDNFRMIVETNLMGSYYTVQAFLPAMREAKAGQIINIVSDAGITANAKAGVGYIASKFAQRGLTQSINLEERGNGIRATAIFPGDIDTPLLNQRPTPPSAEARTKMLTGEDVAKCVMLAIDLPERAIVEELLIRPR